MEMAHDALVGESLVERATPWVSSFLMHAGFGLLAAFVIFAAVGPKTADDAALPIALPVTTSADDPLLTGKSSQEYPRTSAEEIQAMQNRIRNAKPGTDPFGSLDSIGHTTSGMGETKLTDVPWIGLGTGLSTGIGNGMPGGDGPGNLALFGPKTQIGSGPHGSGTIAGKEVVYLLDNSGSMLDSFDYLREEVNAAVQRLLPFQSFAVIMFSETATVLGPDHLRRATAETKADVISRLARVRTGGENDYMLKPFQDGFEKAFAMKPQVIIFLTDGNFDPRLVDVVRRLNKDQRVRIYTMAYVQIDPVAAEGLKTIAKDGGGTYKFIAQKDLGK